MKQQEKKEYLRKSPLFRSLLSGNEIRYSDVIGYFIETFIFNPLANKSIKYNNIYVYREKSHTDLWINAVNSDSTKPEVDDSLERPLFLIENKLKTLPIDNQLRNYSEVFVNSYIDYYKGKIKQVEGGTRVVKNKLFDNRENIQSEIRKLEFFLLLPISKEKQRTITCDIPKINFGQINELQLTWKIITYEKLGSNIYKFINKKKKEGSDIYLYAFFNDFAKILMSFSILSRWFNDLSMSKSIIKVFNAPDIFKELNMEDLYSKFRASQCAEQLSIMIHNSLISDLSFNEIDSNKIYIHTSFSRKSSLFEVKQRIGKDIIYVIQYQAGVLKKGLAIKTETANKYYDWFKHSWFIKVKESEEREAVFEVKNEAGQKDEDKFYKYSINKKLTFYYSIYRIVKKGRHELTIKEILNLMKYYISDVPTINGETQTNSICRVY